MILDDCGLVGECFDVRPPLFDLRAELFVFLKELLEVALNTRGGREGQHGFGEVLLAIDNPLFHEIGVGRVRPEL